MCGRRCLHEVEESYNLDVCPRVFRKPADARPIRKFIICSMGQVLRMPEESLTHRASVIETANDQ